MGKKGSNPEPPNSVKPPAPPRPPRKGRKQPSLSIEMRLESVEKNICILDQRASIQADSLEKIADILEGIVKHLSSEKKADVS